MFNAHSIDDIHYFRERAEKCRIAAEHAADPSARASHLKLAKIYESRLATAMEGAALRSTA